MLPKAMAKSDNKSMRADQNDRAEYAMTQCIQLAGYLAFSFEIKSQFSRRLDEAQITGTL